MKSRNSSTDKVLKHNFEMHISFWNMRRVGAAQEKTNKISEWFIESEAVEWTKRFSIDRF